MRPCRFVLLVEDDEDQIGTWQAEFTEFNDNEESPFKVHLRIARTLEEAQKILRGFYINAAVVDLRVPGSSGTAAAAEAGNKALQDIIESVSGPTAVFSGHAGDIASFVGNTPIQVFKKESEELTAVVRWFSSHASLMTAIDEATTDIKHEMAEIFTGSIWRRWEETKQENLQPDILRKVVTRQVVAHISEQLSLPLNDAPPYHPYEFYFEPPLRKDRMHTGDLLALGDEVYVILSPQCDMVRDYPEKVLLAKCSNIPGWATFNVAKKQSYARQNALKSHFIPGCGAGGPWLVDFKHLITIDGKRIEDNKPARFASIAPQFIPHLIQRFAAFLGRVGQPELEV